MQHTEPDHSGSIEKLLQLAPDITIVGTIGAITFLKEILNREFKHIVVKDGDTLPLGGKTLQFLQLPFCTGRTQCILTFPKTKLL